jgi:hypothetical protein
MTATPDPPQAPRCRHWGADQGLGAIVRRAFSLDLELTWRAKTYVQATWPLPEGRGGGSQASASHQPFHVLLRHLDNVKSLFVALNGVMNSLYFGFSLSVIDTMDTLDVWFVL